MQGSKFLVWDALFSEHAITDKSIPKDVTNAMEAHCQNLMIDSAMRWNTVLGGGVTRSGFTSGIRLLYSIDGLSVDDVNNSILIIENFSHDHVAWAQLRIAEILPLPLDNEVKNRFQPIGRLGLFVEFTDGLGFTELSKIKTAKGDQTVETKNGLDPTATGKKNSGKIFSDEFRSMMGDSNWFTRHHTPADAITIKNTIGGMYEVSFDLTKAINKITEMSEGEWWSKLDPTELTLNPILWVDSTNTIPTPFDPHNWYHHNITKRKTNWEKIVKWEMHQTNNSDELLDEIEYSINRMTKGRRPQKTLTQKQGVVAGNEHAAVANHFVSPWIAMEFINCLAYFLMSAKPKFWRNGRAEVWLFHDLSSISIEEII